jgi:hypothetical protein
MDYRLSKLAEYVNGIEKNFSFLKDPVIVNSLFLKKAERIEVLGLVLGVNPRARRRPVQQSGVSAVPTIPIPRLSLTSGFTSSRVIFPLQAKSFMKRFIR